jgi:hypothetical protein
MAKVQHKTSSPPLSSINGESEQFAGKLHAAVSHQPFQSEGSATLNKVSQDCPTSLASGLESSNTTLSDSLAPSGNPMKSSASNEVQNETDSTPKKKKKTTAKRFSKGSKGSKGSIEEGSLPAEMVRIPTEKSVGENSEAGSSSHMRSDSSTIFSHMRSDSNATTMSALSSQGTPLKAESEASEDEKVEKSESTLAKNVSISSNSASNQAPQSGKQGDRPHQQKANSGDDVFGDSKTPAVEPSSESQAPRHTKANPGSSAGSSVRKRDIEAINTRNRSQDGSPTPSKKVKSASQKKQPVKKVVDSNRKENEQIQFSVTQMLSDPSHWPALGSARPPAEFKSGSHQRMASVVKPLGERMPLPSLSGRDSSASVASGSPKNARRQTLVASFRTGS